MESPVIDRRNLLLAGFASSLGLTSCVTAAPITAGVTSRYADRPAVMAIGDSLYQGVRSLSFTADLAQHSPPMQVARALNLPMTAPDPVRPILFELEASLRRGGFLSLGISLRGDSIANAAEWSNIRPWSRNEAFDNVSIGGAEISSLYTDSYTTAWPTAEAMVARITQSLLPDFAAIGQLWFALNTCFTLNPQQRD